MGEVGIGTPDSCGTQKTNGFDQNHSLQDKAGLKFSIIITEESSWLLSQMSSEVEKQ